MVAEQQTVPLRRKPQQRKPQQRRRRHIEPLQTVGRRNLRKPPLLRWRSVAEARYYNVQLFRNGHKILSAWPSRSHYRLRRTWHYRGHRYRLGPATYRWYLWAGYGARSAHHYGGLLGQRSFTVR